MDEEDVAPLVDWSKPYTLSILNWATKTSENIGVVSDSAPTCGFPDAWKAVLVESPSDMWCAWLLDHGNPTAWAPTLDSHAPEFAEFCSKQRFKVGLGTSVAPADIRVPPCPEHKKDCGVAALVNALWMTGKKRGHPGAIAYVERRQIDYEAAMQPGATAKTRPTAPWRSEVS
jgi:hypothetical protein